MRGYYKIIQLFYLTKDFLKAYIYQKTEAYFTENKKKCFPISKENLYIIQFLNLFKIFEHFNGKPCKNYFKTFLKNVLFLF